MTSSSSKGKEPCLADQVSSLLRKEILEGGPSSAESSIIFGLINGRTSPCVAAVDLLAVVARAQDSLEVMDFIIERLFSLITDYPLLQPHLIALLSAMYNLPSSTPQRREFLGVFSQWAREATHADYSHLFNEELPELIRDYIAMSGFYARLLNLMGEWPVLEGDITGLWDALFVLCEAIEDETTAHTNPNIDISAAAMYLIHAGEILFKESKKETGRELCPADPIWSIRGHLWDGEYGFSVGRWKLWKSRFEFYGCDQMLLDETRSLARMAVKSMNEVEVDQKKTPEKLCGFPELGS